MALSANLNTAFVGHLERGLKSPTMTTLDKIINALGITYSEFFAPEQTEPDDEKMIIIEGILLEIRNLSREDLESIAKIVHEIVRMSISD